MSTFFEVGKYYSPYAGEYDPVLITKRTEKTIWVEREGGHHWMMRIKHDRNGNEIAIDSSVPPSWRVCFTYDSQYPEDISSES